MSIELSFEFAGKQKALQPGYSAKEASTPSNGERLVQ
jgi:hypothetical protein